jgi:CO dehydrogenase maturation factor
MAYTIAISGKGGVGKTTVAALLTTRLAARGLRPVLAIDADPNHCLDAALGLEATHTVGGIREDARRLARRGPAAGIDTKSLLELKIARSLIETPDFDLLVMGRPEGPGCYCYANRVLGDAIRRTGRDYRCLVLDNEAGLENLSRRIVTNVNLLVLVADPSRQGLETVRRLHALAHEMEIEHETLAILVNRASAVPDGARELAAAAEAQILADVPDDEAIAGRSRRGQSLRDLPDSNPVARAVDGVLDAAKLGLVSPVREDA